ncbi:hypothetical protein HZS55_16945 [Halosimplex rubrum]|uniref:DUF835 domain-containing protein n=1 Tax=Halosimplex rubrum TaxID=869889 RepID=A0A7D5TQI0_9EURY|nr:hypothetical protein [Halosimplex rubrum]QLH78874.1 hypothetical protein HZS55_16945 [Halosimplex rubrum]
MTEGVRRANEGVRSSERGDGSDAGEDGTGDADEVGTGSVALVCEPAFRADAAGQLDRALNGESARSVLGVLYRHDVQAWTTALRTRCDRVDSAAVAAVGPVADADRSCDRLPVRNVSDPTDLTGVAIAVGEWLRARDADEQPVVCLDSLSTLLQYADLERAFRFLHALVARVRSAGATAYVSVDPGAHDGATLATLRTLFDAVVGTERRAGDTTAAAPTDASESSADSTGRAVVTDGGDPGVPSGAASGTE